MNSNTVRILFSLFLIAHGLVTLRILVPAPKTGTQRSNFLPSWRQDEVDEILADNSSAAAINCDTCLRLDHVGGYNGWISDSRVGIIRCSRASPNLAAAGSGCRCNLCVIAGLILAPLGYRGNADQFWNSGWDCFWLVHTLVFIEIIRLHYFNNLEKCYPHLLNMNTQNCYCCLNIFRLTKGMISCRFFSLIDNNIR